MSHTHDEINVIIIITAKKIRSTLKYNQFKFEVQLIVNHDITQKSTPASLCYSFMDKTDDLHYGTPMAAFPLICCTSFLRALLGCPNVSRQS